MSEQWYQQALTPPEVVEGHLRLGLIPSTDHVQALVEVKDPITGILIATWSAPHERLANFAPMAQLAADKLVDLLSSHLEPF